MKRSEIIGTCGPDRDVGIKQYDFRRPDKFSRKQIRSLSIIHEQAVRDLTRNLSALLGREAVVRLEMVDQMTFDEFLSLCPEGPGVYSIYGDSSTSVSSLVHYSNSLSMNFLHCLCGGAGSIQAPDKDLSDMELSLFEGVCLPVSSSLSRAWKIADVTWPCLRQLETNKLFVSFLPPGEMIVYLRLGIRIEGLKEHIDIALPYLFLQTHLQKLTPSSLYRDTSAGAKQNGGERVVKPQCERVIPMPGMDSETLYALKPRLCLRIPLSRKGVQMRTGGVIGADPGSQVTVGILPAESQHTLPVPEESVSHRQDNYDDLLNAVAELPEDSAELIFRTLQPILPQIQAAVISLLSSKSAAAVLNLYYPEKAAELLQRLSELRIPDISIHQELAGSFMRILTLQRDPSPTSPRGSTQAADILQYTDAQVREAFMRLDSGRDSRQR